MSTLYLIALMVVGVILANIISLFVPKIPEAFLLVIIGAAFSFIPYFNNFTLEPELFMLLIIAPIMFMDGQEQSFQMIKKNIRVIIELSVTLAIFTALIVGLVTDHLEDHWTFPLSIALAAIVVPTDAVAVKSMTSGLAMPKGVNNALELESLFNDATGLVLLDLALSVLTKGSFSAIKGVEHFLIVATGGVIVGIIGSFIIVRIRYQLNLRAVNAEATTIPINLLTPFVIYLLAEHWGFSGILAVVASGIVHNWESSRLRLNSTDVQLTTHTIWETLTTILNEVVFLILGLSLPSVIQEMIKIGTTATLQLLALSITIYVVMFLERFWWVKVRKSQQINNIFGNSNHSERRPNAIIFAISGVHGTVTLAMALSLPTIINGQPFPYRNELIIIATLVILISLLVAAIVLPRILPAETTSYTADEVNQIRDRMIDYAILQSQENISDRNMREAIAAQLNSQKTNLRDFDQVRYSDAYLTALGEAADFVSTYTHGDYVNATYSDEVVSIYNKILQRTLLNPNKRQHPIRTMRRQIHRFEHEMRFHISTRTFTRKQRRAYHKQKLVTDSNYAAKIKKWKNTQEILLALNNDVMQAVDLHMEDILRENLENKIDNTDVYRAHRTLDRFFLMVQHDYQQQPVEIDSATFIQIFQYEFDFVQRGIQKEEIKPAVANILFSEINQAQALQLLQSQQSQIALEK